MSKIWRVRVSLFFFSRWPVIYPHRTKLASLPEESIAFPMKAKYIFTNRTIEGEEKFTEERNAPEVRESPPECLPPPAPVEKEVVNADAGTAMAIAIVGELT